MEVKRLLPYSYKKWGFVCLLAGVFFMVMYLTGYMRIDSPMVAVYSGFLEKHFLSVTRTDLIDELALLFLLTALIFFVFSEEKNETEYVVQLRYKALLTATALNFIFLMLGTMFMYGMGFGVVLMANLFSYPVFYLLAFKVLIHKMESNKNKPTL